MRNYISMADYMCGNAVKNDTNSYINLRYPRHHEPSGYAKIMAAGGSVIGTVGALLCAAKCQNKNLFKIKDVLDINYGIKEIAAVGTSSVTGGVALGCLADKKDDNIPKVKEGIFQIMNVIIPALFTGGLMKLTDMFGLRKNRPAKIAAITFGVTGGMLAASSVANFINDPNNNEKDRKITPKDALANLDDAIGALVLAKFPIVGKLQLQRAIPVIYSWCGYRAGASN